MSRAIPPYMFACSIQMVDAVEFIWRGSMAENAMYAAISLTLGFAAIRHTDWLVRQALLIARRCPGASAGMLAERSCYPRVLRGLGAALLFCGFIFSASITLRIFWVLNLHV